MRKQIYEAQTCWSIDFLGIGRTRCDNLRLYIFLRSRSCRKTAILKLVYKVSVRWFKVSQCLQAELMARIEMGPLAYRSKLVGLFQI